MSGDCAAPKHCHDSSVLFSMDIICKRAQKNLWPDTAFCFSLLVLAGSTAPSLFPPPPLRHPVLAHGPVLASRPYALCFGEDLRHLVGEAQTRLPARGCFAQ